MGFEKKEAGEETWVSLELRIQGVDSLERVSPRETIQASVALVPFLQTMRSPPEEQGAVALNDSSVVNEPSPLKELSSRSCAWPPPPLGSPNPSQPL